MKRLETNYSVEINRLEISVLISCLLFILEEVEENSNYDLWKCTSKKELIGIKKDLETIFNFSSGVCGGLNVLV